MLMLAQSGLPMTYDDAEKGNGKPVDLMPDGPARFSLQEKRPVYDNDITESVHLSPIRRLALRLGSKSVISLPLMVEEGLFGLLVLYAPDRNFFDEEELKLLKELAGDISYALEFIAKEEKVDYLAYYDTLTGLPNRNLFFDALKRQLGQAEHDGQKVVLQLLDIDRFRMINETYGRDQADRLIAAIAKRIETATGGQNTVARVGPDSFAVAISGVWQEARIAHALDELNEKVFSRPFVLKGEELRVSATAGVAVYPGDGAEPFALLGNAEAAQQSAEKQNIRFQLYSPAMNERVADSMRLENRLRRALEQDEILMWYQPKASLRTGALTGFEALMRWQDGESGDMVQPAKFIPIMEQTGLILDAGRRALSKVAGDCGSWAGQTATVLRVAINISLLQLREDTFVESVMDAQEKAASAGCALELELTESVLMDNVESILPKLHTLHGLGVRIAVDDFGTGYSSLAYIARLPIHALKIDRSFVLGMTQNQNSLTIVKSTISLAHSLGLSVVAEGVETIEQAELLAELECDEMQGYYLSRPVPPNEVPALIRDLDDRAGSRN
jgi:diguanylate cyclase (GGDEF)-like protein